MEQSLMDPNLESALCRLISQLTGFPIESIEEFDKLNNLRQLGLQIDDVFFGQRLISKDLTWESFVRDLEEYLEGFEVYHGLFVDEGADLDQPNRLTIMSLLSQILAIHWLSSPKIDEELGNLDDVYREAIINCVGGHKAQLAEAIAQEVIAAKKESMDRLGESRSPASSMQKASTLSTLSSTNRLLISKVNDKEKQVEMGLFKMQKMEEYIESLKVDISNACAKNDELELVNSNLTSENQRLKNDQRYQRRRQEELEADLEREKTEREGLAEQLAAEQALLAKNKQELTIYIEKEEEYTRLLTMESTYKQYMEERSQFMQAKSEMKETIHDLVKVNEQGRARMNDLSKLCAEQEAKLAAESQRLMSLQEENLILANENQQLRVEVDSYHKMFSVESLNKRKGDVRGSPSPPPALRQAPVMGIGAGPSLSVHKEISSERSAEAEQLKQQIVRLRSENQDLRKKMSEDEREFRKELEGALEVHKKQAQLLEEARFEAASAHQAYLELKENAQPMGQLGAFGIGTESSRVFSAVRSVGAEGSLGVAGTEAQVQVGPELLEKQEIDTNYLVYSAVMEFMGGHMEHFRDSQLRLASARNPLANFFSGGRLRA